MERQDDVCNWSVCHDIAAQRYRRANAVQQYRRSEKPTTISYVAMGPTNDRVFTPKILSMYFIATLSRRVCLSVCPYFQNASLWQFLSE